MNGWKARVKRYSGRATERAASSHFWIAQIFGTCSPSVMCSAVDDRRSARASEIASDKPCEMLSPIRSSKIVAIAGSPRKPMPSEVSVMPSWQADR